MNILSVERLKGIVTIQHCSVENQKGAITVQNIWQGRRSDFNCDIQS